ncbi:hypothetical protein BD31_I0769 [Candidatus Nitrosopumilus salaria BD31]|uniref:ScoMcrA-like SRA domain-containing protein n=1 Tax=Candidatus Nitrosopumilus salarius BD31 TaxID=859350 RepID=I3CZV3_9ARCH|nr:hypothetical protein [Candidatus Nitrosopumilus salaria]EIJ64996.1 hypothetical protein BD31_I0769 [Candidatus Nitrosopumilus salaria BD31]
MEFCDICKSKKIKTFEGFKCQNCDDYNPNTKNPTKKPVYSENESFPYIKDEYYVQKEIRKKLGLGLMSGINPNRELRIIVLFRNAHVLKPNQTNVYLDKYDKETGIYRYVGKGLIGDQTLDGDNGLLKNAAQNNYKVHLFWQHNANSNHQYVGEVNVKDVIPDSQPDKNGKNRKVFVFLLK